MKVLIITLLVLVVLALIGYAVSKVLNRIGRTKEAEDVKFITECIAIAASLLFFWVAYCILVP